MNQRRFLIILGLGLVLRLLMITGPGTGDLQTIQIWGARAVEQGVTRVYVLDDSHFLIKYFLYRQGSPSPAARISYQTEIGLLNHMPDYPPLSIYQFWFLTWTAKALGGGTLRDGPLLNGLFNTLPVLFSLAILLMAWRLARAEGWPSSEFALAAFWLNPALILHTPILGYVDAVFAGLGLASLIALYKRRIPTAVIALALACMVKPQGVLILPIVALGIVWERNQPLLRRQLGVFALLCLAPFLPFVLTGRMLGALRGTFSVLHPLNISSDQMNIWWLVTWIYGFLAHGLSLGDKVSAIPLEEFPGLPLLNVRVLALLLWASFLTLTLRWLWQELERGNRRAIFWAGALHTYGYAMLSLYSMENHLYAFFVYALPVLLICRREVAALYAGLSFVFGMNIFLFDGFGRDFAGPGRVLRMLPGFDLTVLVAAINVVFFVWLLTRPRWLFGLTRFEAAADRNDHHVISNAH